MHVAITAALVVQTGCATSQESKVRDPIAARFPDGPRRCMPLPGDATGIHVQPPSYGVIWFPSSGPTSPTRHAFVLYAAPEAAAVPELVAELTRQGVVKQTVVEATTDLQSQRMAPVSHETVYGHERNTLPVAIYETAPWSPEFDYITIEAAAVGTSFPSRTDEGPLPSQDLRYTVPLTRPYAISTVSAACLAETVDEVSGIETKTSPFGGAYVQATVTFKAKPPPWMLSPTFSRAAVGPSTPSLTAPRRALVILRPDGEKLVYVREER